MDADHANPDDLATLRAALGPVANRPALGWPAVHAFEAEHGIVLPEPYRTVVAEICDGTKAETGPPAYGLVPVAEVPDDWRDGDDGERDLARPFPLAEDVEWDEGDWDDDALEAVSDHGSVILGTDGCGMYWHLIVTGPSRGHIWHIDEYGATPFGAEFGHSTGKSGFTGWVKHWLAKKDDPEFMSSTEDWFDAEK
ncbi:SMI1/KNR4 family protein [Streptomyces sp. T-3]|nr:SMI1/KNR4 family protein [Streptomyces sp. T-3]